MSGSLPSVPTPGNVTVAWPASVHIQERIRRCPLEVRPKPPAVKPEGALNDSPVPKDEAQSLIALFQLGSGGTAPRKLGRHGADPDSEGRGPDCQRSSWVSRVKSKNVWPSSTSSCDLTDQRTRNRTRRNGDDSASSLVTFLSNETRRDAESSAGAS
ncbi:hypothetical protein NDU88_006061 [Pleurodeles waltl]|uniref:Uncharacterized protein n=1 Tax=Pleurodeles waltl TaxID=8319 RepID=A0AAV7WWH3_PLEWA|nr:hypothetical protein NDU88_006061 [Pleurodeles waltl]